MLIDAADYGLSPGGIGPLIFRAVPITGASKAGQNYSELGILVPDGIANLDGKVLSSLFPFSVSDTVSISVTESPVDSQEIQTADTVRLSLVEVSQLFNNVGVTDTTRLGLSESINLTVAGVTDKPVTDTASLTLSAETAVLDVTLDVTDTASLTLSGEVASVDVSVEDVVVSDDCTLTISSEEALLNIFAGINTIDRDDIVSLRISNEFASVREIGFVTRIEIEIENPLRIELEIE